MAKDPGILVRNIREAAVRNVEESRALIESVTLRPGYSSFVGAEVSNVAQGAVEMALGRRPELTQTDGYFHGGVISGLADHTAGAAVTSALPEGRFCLTVNLNVTFLAPADGERLVARAEAIRVSSSIGTARVSVFSEAADGEETLCAIATATMRAIDMKS